MRRGLDDVDLLAIEWARQRRIMLGIVEMGAVDKGEWRTSSRLTPQERLGKLQCTLRDVRQEGSSALTNSTGHVEQNWPEVYRGDALIVHIAYSKMPGKLREVMHTHYVFREIDLKARQAFLKLTPAQYFVTLASLKQFIRGALAVAKRAENERDACLAVASF